MKLTQKATKNLANLFGRENIELSNLTDELFVSLGIDEAEFCKLIEDYKRNAALWKSMMSKDGGS
tara:strand:- start:481 stop:675 length:195 start_codon:yes stop_codon:yes gene_type:complete